MRSRDQLYTHLMPAPRRIPRFLANPFTTLALLAYLVLDLTLLVRDLPNADSTIARVLSGRGAPPVAAARHDFIAACLPTGNVIIDCRGRTEVEARDMVPVGAMPILDVAFVRETSPARCSARSWSSAAAPRSSSPTAPAP